MIIIEGGYQMERDHRDLELQRTVESLFIAEAKKQDVAQPHVLAAMITAASAMSIPSGITTPELTTEELLDLYGKKEDGKVTSLLGMSSSYIKLNTGYSVEVEDMGSAYANYSAQKEEYDRLYTSISERAKSHEKEEGKAL